MKLTRVLNWQVLFKLRSVVCDGASQGRDSEAPIFRLQNKRRHQTVSTSIPTSHRLMQRFVLQSEAGWNNLK